MLLPRRRRILSHKVYRREPFREGTLPGPFENVRTLQALLRAKATVLRVESEAANLRDSKFFAIDTDGEECLDVITSIEEILKLDGIPSNQLFVLVAELQFLDGNDQSAHQTKIPLERSLMDFYAFLLPRCHGRIDPTRAGQQCHFAVSR